MFITELKYRLLPLLLFVPLPQNGQEEATKAEDCDKSGDENEKEEEEEDEEEEEEDSSDPDIEEEIQASAAEVRPGVTVMKKKACIIYPYSLQTPSTALS